MSDVINFTDLKNKATDKDIKKFEDYILSLYYSMAQGEFNIIELSLKIQNYMKENNISENKFNNIQAKLIDKYQNEYGIDLSDIDNQLKSLGVDTKQSGIDNINYQDIRKKFSFEQKYNGKIEQKMISSYSITNEKNSISIYLFKDNVLLKSKGKVNLEDNELNDFLCSYKKTLNDSTLKIEICENTSDYNY
ncbi:MAG: DUF3867 family protein [Clostridiaceae bacterium]